MTVQQDFPNPPGGKLICDDDQTAIVDYNNGVVTASCSTPPQSMRITENGSYTQDFKRWVLSAVTGEYFDDLEPLSLENEQIFQQREYRRYNPDGTYALVTFMLPTRFEGGSGPDLMGTAFG